MRRFRFRLAPLLRLRSQFERSSRRELATAMAAVNTVDQQIAAAAQGLKDCADQGAQPGALGQLARALENGLKRHQWRLRSELQKAQNRVEVVRADYVIKARDLKTLKNLRDKRREEWRREATKAEQAELDELARLSRAGSLFGQKLGIEEA
ncbi:MAG: flagellar export protein FliJ [Planctomycetes bacterium]|nr:flagellar export protein FliJ [Planctomycetota bacterium]